MIKRISVLFFVFAVFLILKIPIYAAELHEEVAVVDSVSSDCFVDGAGAVDNILTFTQKLFAPMDWSRYTIKYELTDEQKALWERLDSVYDVYLYTDKAYQDEYVNTNYKNSTVLANEIFFYLYAHPQLFFLRGNLTLCENNDLYSVKISFYEDFKDGKRRQQALGNITEKLNIYNKEVSGCDSELLKLKKAHDLICLSNSYDKEVVSAGYDWNNDPNYSQSIYSSLCLGKTVCAGYGKAVNMLASYAGLTSKVVTSSGHLWNVQTVEGTEYVTDPTWDDEKNNYMNFLTCGGYSHNPLQMWDTYASPSETDYFSSELYGAFNVPVGTSAIYYDLGADKSEISNLSKLPVKYKEGKSKKLTKPKREGYSFKGYFCQDKIMEKIPKDARGSFILTLKWEPNTYTIKFKENGGSGSMANIVAVYDEEVRLPDCAYTNKKGYTFAGWGRTKKRADYHPGDVVKNLVADKTVKLYAIWQK